MRATPNSALLLIDLQRAFCSPFEEYCALHQLGTDSAHYPRNDEAAKLCKEFSDRVRGKIDIIHIGMVRGKAEGNATESFSGPMVSRGFNNRATGLMQFFISEPASNDFVFWKRDDGFSENTPLLKLLKHKGINTPFIAGVNTFSCVYSVAKRLANDGLAPIVIKDLCRDARNGIGTQNYRLKDNPWRGVGVQMIESPQILSLLGP